MGKQIIIIKFNHLHWIAMLETLNCVQIILLIFDSYT